MPDIPSADSVSATEPTPPGDPVSVLRGVESGLVDAIAEADRAVSAAVAIRAALLERLDGTASMIARAESDATGRPRRSDEFVRRSVRAEVACALRLSERSADTLLGTAVSLVRHHPDVWAALGRGTISERHARVLLDQVGGLDDAHAAAVVDEVLPDAGELTAPELARRTAAVIDSSDPRSLIDRRRRAMDRRGVWVTPARDGMAWLEALLPTEVALAGFDRLTTMAAGVQRIEADAVGGADRIAPAEMDGSDPDAEPRSRDQVRADLLADLLLDSEPADLPERLRGIRPVVTVTVPVLSLLGRDTPATLDGTTPVDAATARRLVGAATSVTRLLTHPETGAPLSYGRDTYRPPEHLVRALRHRDGRCRFPGCRIPARRADLDHSRAWRDGGRTDADNLLALCRGHHRLRHHSDWTVRHERDRAGTVTWTSPAGRAYRTRPQSAPGSPVVSADDHPPPF